MKVGALPRLLRVQFTPIMIAPVILGAAASWHYSGSFEPALFIVTLAGAVMLHLAANGIDDAYDYVSGTDGVAERMFPPGAPGWKPIARGLFSVGEAMGVSYFLYIASLGIGVLLSLLVGWYALAIAVPGVVLSYFYTAPPLKLDYRGLGLGELSVLLSFGPLPALGTYYVMARGLSILPVILAIPSGLLTTAILMNHDQIFYDVYKESGKRSLTVVLGRRSGARVSTSLSILACVLLLVFVGFGVAPWTCLAALLAVPALARASNIHGKDLSPPQYGSKTIAAFLGSTAFTLLFAAGLVLG